MNKTKTASSAKSTLICSLLALLLSCTMLLGTTYAWFTDRVTVGQNQIVAGNLDVALSHRLADGSYDEVSEKTALFLNALGESMLWEPAAATEETFRISNEGTLALQYRFALSFFDATETKEGKTLADALSIRVIPLDGETELPLGESVPLEDFLLTGKLLAGESLSFRVIIEWIPSAKDNDFNLNNGRTGKNGETALSISLGISLEATQYAHEQDGYGDDYDADVPPHLHYVSSFSELQEAISCGGYVQLAKDIALEKTLSVTGEVVLDLNGKTLSIADGAVLDPMINCAYGSFLTVTGNGKVDIGKHKSVSFIAPRGTVVIENGTFTRDYEPNGAKLGSYGSLFVGINVEAALRAGYENASSNVIIKGGYFDGGFYSAEQPNGAITGLNVSFGGVLHVYGGTYVGYNPANGDEGMGYQGWFLDGQTALGELPAGYAITETALADGRPAFTVTYEAP